jgi:hypothetical protein
MPVMPGDPYSALDAALRAHLVGALAGDLYRDINALATHRDASGCLYYGTWNGQLRLTAGIVVDSARVADVLLIATKGSLPATDAIFGKTGPDVGNSILVARLLHAALFALRFTGVVGVRNDPFDARVRRLYEDMGFHGGAYLPLHDISALTKTFTYIAKIYQHPATVGRLSLASPPLPL